MNNDILSFKPKLQKLGMLNHPFYQALWNTGRLSKEDIKHYSEQYYSIEKTFLTCLKNMLTFCDNNKQAEKITTINLNDELGNGNQQKSHLTLWLQMAEFYGSNKQAIEKCNLNPETQALVDTFLKLSKQSLPAAVGVLYSYEHQIPEVSESKIKTLCDFYGATPNGQELSFFKEHGKADIWHTAQWEKLIENFNTTQFNEFKDAAIKGIQTLLHFLDGIMRQRCLTC